VIFIKTLDIFNELSEYITVKINSCREEFHDRTWIENKVHKDYDMWFILDGHVGIEINGLSYSAAEGDVILFYPGVPYSAYMGQDGCRFVYIHFDFSMGNNFRILNDFNFAGIIPAETVGEEGGIFRKGWYGLKESDVSSILLKGYFTILVSKVLQSGNGESKRHFFPQSFQQKCSGRLNTLQPVFKYISERIDKRIKIQELSNIACMSEKYFIKFFKEAIGISPLVYINQLKMNRARNYIYQGRYSIKQIANLLGYSDQYTFSKAFKKYFNVSPSRFV